MPQPKESPSKPPISEKTVKTWQRRYASSSPRQRIWVCRTISKEAKEKLGKSPGKNASPEVLRAFRLRRKAVIDALANVLNKYDAPRLLELDDLDDDVFKVAQLAEQSAESNDSAYVGISLSHLLILTRLKSGHLSLIKASFKHRWSCAKLRLKINERNGDSSSSGTIRPLTRMNAVHQGAEALQRSLKDIEVVVNTVTIAKIKQRDLVVASDRFSKALSELQEIKIQIEESMQTLEESHEHLKERAKTQANKTQQ